MLDKKVLEILVCPLTGGKLSYDVERSELISEEAGLAYPVRGGIPIMLVDEARKLNTEPEDSQGSSALQASNDQ